MTADVLSYGLLRQLLARLTRNGMSALTATLEGIADASAAAFNEQVDPNRTLWPSAYGPHIRALFHEALVPQSCNCLRGRGESRESINM
jgi:hypothetical protein